MYGKFDKYDLFRAANNAFDCWQGGVKDSRDDGYISAAKNGYFMLYNLICCHGLSDDYKTWLEAQQ